MRWLNGLRHDLYSKSMRAKMTNKIRLNFANNRYGELTKRLIFSSSLTRLLEHGHDSMHQIRKARRRAVKSDDIILSVLSIACREMKSLNRGQKPNLSSQFTSSDIVDIRQS